MFSVMGGNVALAVTRQHFYVARIDVSQRLNASESDASRWRLVHRSLTETNTQRWSKQGLE